MNKSYRMFLAASGALLVFSACGTGSSTSAPSPSPAPTTTDSSSSIGSAYKPTVVPTDFGTVIDHPYYPLKPGTTKVFEGLRDGKPMHTEVVVTDRTRVVLGVKCVVITDTVTSNGALVEKTEDWFAQKNDGSVWYFGENTAEYANGVVSSTHGTWEAGVDGAVPGVIMHARPKVGTEYYQEYRPVEAEDLAKILSLDSKVKVPAGTFTNVITTEDSDPLNPDKTDMKWYAPGVGVVRSIRIKSSSKEEMKLVKVVRP